jgi:branched-chain amino acid transport system ATP-binding protein
VSGEQLELRGVSTGYGDIQAIWDVSFTVTPGSTTVLLGPNGAGKTTILNLITGLLPLWSGHLTWGENRDISKIPAYDRIDLGLALVQEGKRVFRRRTVEENLVIAARSGSLGSRKLRQAIDGQYERFPILGTRRNKAASTLSGGEQQMLAIAQALITKPRILILDEPSSGLAPVILNPLFDLFGVLRSEGIGVLLVEQLVHRALALADDVVVLGGGRVQHHALAREISDSSVIEEIYFQTGSSAT